ncbi:MAG: sialidase family protein [Victivallales bacterium]
MKMNAGWNDRAPIELQGLRVTMSEPVLVRRSNWFCHYPSLIRQPSGRLWATIQANADEAVPGVTTLLSRSDDGGLTWEEPFIIGGGRGGGGSDLLLADGSAVVIPMRLRPRPGVATIGAPCYIISPEGRPKLCQTGVNVSGWSRPLQPVDTAGLGLASFVFDGQVVRGRAGEYLTTLYGKFEGDSRFTVVLAESADGFSWRIRSIIVGADCLLKGEEGPCEAAVCRLVTGAGQGRLMCVFRLGGLVPYGQTWSEDDGRTWTKPVPMPAFSVEPSLQVMPSGIIALSGGRPGIYVWLNTDGSGTSWQAVDVLTHHNACRSRTEDQISKTTSYTELMPLDERRLLLIYDRLEMYGQEMVDNENVQSVWALRITLD